MNTPSSDRLEESNASKQPSDTRQEGFRRPQPQPGAIRVPGIRSRPDDLSSDDSLASETPIQATLVDENAEKQARRQQEVLASRLRVLEDREAQQKDVQRKRKVLMTVIVVISLCLIAAGATWIVLATQEQAQAVPRDASGFRCFTSNQELRLAIQKYVNESSTAVKDEYGASIGDWCVHRVTDMSRAFYHLVSFNEPLEWDVSRVTDMSDMFSGISFEEPHAFNQDIGSWNVSSVQTMVRMFAFTDAWNQDLSSWDTSSVADMSMVFLGASSFNQDVSVWDVSHATSMQWMFAHAKSFNQDMCQWKDKLSSDFNEREGMFWDTSCVAKEPLEGYEPGQEEWCHPCP